jgi:hypothetical protein
MLFLVLLHKIRLNCKVGDYKIGPFCIITCSSLYECQAFAECLGYGGEGVKSYAITACLDAGNVRPLHLHAVGEVLLGHSFFLSQLGNVLPYALPFLLVLYHSYDPIDTFAMLSSISITSMQ